MNCIFPLVAEVPLCPLNVNEVPVPAPVPVFVRLNLFITILFPVPAAVKIPTQSRAVQNAVPHLLPDVPKDNVPAVDGLTI